MLDVRVTLRAHGDADPDVVWERYADLHQWSRWSPQICRVTAAGTRLRAGLTGWVVGPLGVSVPFEVVSVEGRRWRWVVRPLGLRLQLDHWVFPRLGGAATELRMRGPAPLVLGYAPLAQLALRKLVSA